MAVLYVPNDKRDKLFDIMGEYCKIDISSHRRLFLDTVGISEIAPEIDNAVVYEGSVNEFCISLIDALQDRGTLASSNEPALALLLRYLRVQVAGHRTLVNFLDELLSPWDSQKMRILGLLSRSEVANRKDVVQEKAILEKFLKEKPHFVYKILQETTHRNLSNVLFYHQARIFHYSGVMNDEGLYIQSDGESIVFPWDALAGELHRQDAIQCIILNGCKITPFKFTIGLGLKLPYLLTTPERLGHPEGYAFMQAFYTSLALHSDYQFAFESATTAVRFTDSAFPARLAQPL